MEKRSNTGLRRLINATFFSLAGLRTAWQHEAAFREELILVAVLVPTSFWLGSNAVEYVLLIGSLMIVLIAELLNSALEAVVDRISAENHELSRRAKDMGSAAVFVALVLCGFSWGIIGWQNLAG
jgi:diacylglycerol kinase (ATP)